MAKWNGKQFVLSGERMSYNPIQGESWTVTYKGTRAAMVGLATSWRAGDPRVTVNSEHIGGSVWRTVVTSPYWAPTNNFQLITEWETDTEMVEKDLFTHPDVQADFGAKTAHAYRKEVEDVVAGTSTATLTTVQDKIALELARGVTGFEAEYQTLTRTRRASNTYPFNYTVLLGQSRRIYSPAELVATFGFPSGLSFSFQSLPANPDQTTWGWRLRDQRVRISGDKLEETVNWVLTSWSNFLYSDT